MRDKVEERLEREKWKRRKQREKKTGSVLGREKCTYLNKIRYRGIKKAEREENSGRHAYIEREQNGE